jgi:predicted O-methyltransferase YrrM
MSILPKLLQIFRDHGYHALTGYNSHFFQNFRDAPFTRLLSTDGQLLGHAGLALQEVMFIEGLASYIAPRNILAIGNAYGWSSVALSLIFPGARVAALDPLTEGIELTNSLAAGSTLSLTAVVGSSPEDVAGTVSRHLQGPVDLALIDAIHTNEAVVADFKAVEAVAYPSTVFIFHDVMTWKLEEALFAIRDMGYRMRILTRTPSGMAVVCKTATADLDAYLGAFSDDPEFFKNYRKFVVESYVDSVSKLVR